MKKTNYIIISIVIFIMPFLYSCNINNDSQTNRPLNNLVALKPNDTIDLKFANDFGYLKLNSDSNNIYIHSKGVGPIRKANDTFFISIVDTGSQYIKVKSNKTDSIITTYYINSTIKKQFSDSFNEFLTSKKTYFNNILSKQHYYLLNKLLPNIDITYANNDNKTFEKVSILHMVKSKKVNIVYLYYKACGYCEKTKEILTSLIYENVIPSEKILAMTIDSSTYEGNNLTFWDMNTRVNNIKVKKSYEPIFGNSTYYGISNSHFESSLYHSVFPTLIFIDENGYIKNILTGYYDFGFKEEIVYSYTQLSTWQLSH